MGLMANLDIDTSTCGGERHAIYLQIPSLKWRVFSYSCISARVHDRPFETCARFVLHLGRLMPITPYMLSPTFLRDRQNVQRRAGVEGAGNVPALGLGRCVHADTIS